MTELPWLSLAQAAVYASYIAAALFTALTFIALIRRGT